MSQNIIGKSDRVGSRPMIGLVLIGLTVSLDEGVIASQAVDIILAWQDIEGIHHIVVKISVLTLVVGTANDIVGRVSQAVGIRDTRGPHNVVRTG